MTDGPAGESLWQCPRCRSDAIQNAAVLYEAGRSSSTGTKATLGIASVGNHLAVGVAGGGGASSSITGLASLVAPPGAPTRQGSWTGPFAGIAIGIGALYSMLHAEGNWFGTLLLRIIPPHSFGRVLILSSPVLLAVAGYVIERAARSPAETRALAEHRKALREWRRLYFCHRCGMTFQRESAD